MQARYKITALIKPLLNDCFKVKIVAKTPEGDLSEELIVAADDIVQGDMVHKMFARKMIQDLEERDHEDGQG